MNRWERELVADCLADLLDNYVYVDLRPVQGIYIAGGDCSGYYEDGRTNVSGNKELVVACGRKDWIQVFAHEYCHFTQDVKDGMFEGYDDVTLWKWLDGEDFPDEVIDHIIEETKKLEGDNERRTMALLEKYSVPVDLTQYARKVNAYLLFHNTVRRDRLWSSPGYPRPYDVPEILAKMSGEILEDFSDGPEWDWFHELVREHCYDRNVTSERILRTDEDSLLGKSYLHVVRRKGRDLGNLLRAGVRRAQGLVWPNARRNSSSEVRKD